MGISADIITRTGINAEIKIKDRFVCGEWNLLGIIFLDIVDFLNKEIRGNLRAIIKREVQYAAVLPFLI